MQVKEQNDNNYFKRSMNSLKPRTSIATIAHGGGNQLLLRLWASWKEKEEEMSYGKAIHGTTRRKLRSETFSTYEDYHYLSIFIVSQGEQCVATLDTSQTHNYISPGFTLQAL